MLFPSVACVGAIRPLVVCLLAGSLGGCYTLGAGGGAGSPATSPTPTPITSTPITPPPITPPPISPPPSTPTPLNFSTFFGKVTSKGVVTSVVTQAESNYVTTTRTMTVLTKEQPDLFSASVDPLVAGSSQQYVGFSGVNYFGTSAALIESSGPVIRGHASNGQDWAVYTNTPGSRLDASLGAPSLQHSYVGVASRSRSQGRHGDGYSLSAGFFGGESTANMPMYGQADYAGTFEGLQEHSVNGAEASKSSISGRANLAVDFGARTVRGRIDNINNHSAGPVKVATDYSLGYSGAISNSSFAGTAWMTHKNSDTPFSGYSQNSGTLQGGFFGSGAAEAAGAIGVSAVGEPVKYLITGAFGAKKR